MALIPIVENQFPVHLHGLLPGYAYPSSLRGLFAVEWDFPSVEPPEYLLRLNPHLYQQERDRITARFDDAVKLAEEGLCRKPTVCPRVAVVPQGHSSLSCSKSAASGRRLRGGWLGFLQSPEEAFVSEFARLVSHLSERLTSDVDGERKIFRDSAITNLTEFFERFKRLNVRSNGDLDRLVETAQRTLSGVDPHIVRNSDSLRQGGSRSPCGSGLGACGGKCYRNRGRFDWDATFDEFISQSYDRPLHPSACG
jgi:hypothetical protein